MLYLFGFKKSIILFLFFTIFQNCIFAKTEKIIMKYEKWKTAVNNPKDAKNVFSFFYNNPHWPLFEESVKIAENNINDSISDSMILTWFKRYTPKTGNGLKSYMKRLIKLDPEKAEEYIKQTWIFQNLSPDFISDYRAEFSDYLTPLDDAKKVKYLTKFKQTDQLKALKKLVNNDISEYISNFLKNYFSSKHANILIKDITNIDQKYAIIQNLIDKNENNKAASILTLSNKDEQKYETSFFNQRRHVAFNILRSGNPKLAYDVMKLYDISNTNQKNEKIAKAEWLLGYISFRFFGDMKKAEGHFKKAFENSINAIRISKNAFWLAEVYYSRGDVLLAFDFYRKAEKYFSTFYGYLSKERIKTISQKHFSIIDKSLDQDNELIIPNDREITFYNRELVLVLLNIKDKSMSKYFYKQLIDEIDDPDEEVLLMDIATANNEIEMLISENSKRQHYFTNNKAYKTLNQTDTNYVRKINSDLCFLALVHSVIHRESNFNQNAKSSAGAVGLMQIMPSTAKHEIKRLKFYTKVSLFDKQKNITIGTSILDRLLKKYQGNLIYSIAAYNCGEGNLAKFQKSISNLKNIKPLDLIELIPIKETRIYVKHVIRALFTYQKKFAVESNPSKILCKVKMIDE